MLHEWMAVWMPLSQVSGIGQSVLKWLWRWVSCSGKPLLYLTLSYWSSVVMRRSPPAGYTLVQNHPSRVDTAPAQVRSSSVPDFAIEEEALAWGGSKTLLLLFLSPWTDSAGHSVHLLGDIKGGLMLTLRSFQASNSIISIWDKPLRTKILLLFHPLTQSESSLPLESSWTGQNPSPQCCTEELCAMMDMFSLCAAQYSCP